MIYRYGAGEFPSICGTGLEDYLGSAWGLGPHASPWQGAPLEVRASGKVLPRYAAFYRWHVPDPVIFSRELRVTIQQIGFAVFRDGEDAVFERYQRTNPAAGHGWLIHPRSGALAMGIAERSDDYCAAAFVYCQDPQAVPRLDVAAALADIAREPDEKPHPMEALFA